MNARRIVAILLVVAGGVLWWLAPETWAGLVLVGIGVVIEAGGIFLEHKR